MTTTLSRQIRGDEFDYSTTLQGGYVASNFAEMWFTLRTLIPRSSSAAKDSDAVAQTTLSADGVVFSDTTNLSVKFPGRLTRHWPCKVLQWDFQGRLTNGKIMTIDRGTIEIAGDITRSQ